jgi:hypothetical protein
LAVSIFDKGSLVIVGPGLVKIYGSDLGAQLLPIVNVGALLALIVSPMLQFGFRNVLDFDYLLAICGGIIVLTSL